MTHRPSKRPHFAARPLPPSADIGPGGQFVGQAAQFCLGSAAGTFAAPPGVDARAVLLAQSRKDYAALIY